MQKDVPVKFPMPRTPTKKKKLKENSESLIRSRSSIASRTRSQSIDSRNISIPKFIDLTIDNDKLPAAKSVETINEEANPKFVKELVIRLEKLDQNLTLVSKQESKLNTENLSNIDSENNLRINRKLNFETSPQSQHSIVSNSGESELFTMANLTYKDLILAIPQFDGNEKEIESFINSCDIYEKLIEEDQSNIFLAIIISKLKGEALAKLQPIAEINNWAELKEKIEEKIRKPLSFEYAQERLCHITQNRNENIEIYGRKIRVALEKLNLASRCLTKEDNALKMLKLANEKLAIQKFEQNLSNPNLKVIVAAANKTTLENTISFAMQKELSNKFVKNCNYCKKEGHYERECFTKNRKFNYFKKSDNFYHGTPATNSNDNSENKNRNLNKNNSFNFKRPQNTFEQRKSNDNFNNKNIRTCQEDNFLNLEDIFKENSSQDPKN